MSISGQKSSIRFEVNCANCGHNAVERKVVPQAKWFWHFRWIQQQQLNRYILRCARLIPSILYEHGYREAFITQHDYHLELINDITTPSRNVYCAQNSVNG